MESCTNLTQDECAEISVKTEEGEPRGTFAENGQKEMTSFETLVHTVLALEEDPRDEHSYAYSDKKSSKEGMDKDHCYYSGSRSLGSRRDIQNLSEEDLSDLPCFDDKYILLPHYQSNDSALDVTGFDNISEKCSSMENLNVKTVDVFTEKYPFMNKRTVDKCTENCILPGVSYPDLSMMTIQGPTSFSLPNSPPSSEIFVRDHSYSFKRWTEEETRAYIAAKKDYFLKDHTYTDYPNRNLIKDHTYIDYSCRKLLGDHTYIDYLHRDGKRRDSLPSNVGIKRGRSNDDMSLLGSYNFKRKDFTVSLLDHSYQNAGIRGETTQNKKQLPSKDNIKVVNTNENVTKLKDVKESEMENESDSIGKTYIVKQALLPSCVLIDHAYEEMTDSTVDMPTGFVTKVNTEHVVETELAQMFGEIKTDKSDHSYVIRKDEPTDKEIDKNLHMEELSDSGTESLNGDDADDFLVTVNKHIYPPLADKEHKEHEYFKRTIKKV